MMKHFAIDLIQEYGTEELPDTERVVNPSWRVLDKSHNSIQNKLRYRLARFAEMSLHPKTENNAVKYEKWVTKKAELLEQFESELDELKMKFKKEPKHIAWSELDEEDKFFRLPQGRKRLTDTVKMIAYRAESSMASILKAQTVDMAAARRLLQDLYVTEAEILPLPEENILHVRVHSASRQLRMKRSPNFSMNSIQLRSATPEQTCL